MIDLCIVSYNTQMDLNYLLTTLNARDLADAPYTLYIQDNGSEDGSAEYVARLMEIRDDHGEFSSLGGVWLKDNVGYAAAANHLATYGSGDIIGILNSDVWLKPSDVMSIQAAFDQDPGMHIMGPKQRDEQGRITHAGIIGTLAAPAHRGWREHDPQDLKYRDQIECVTVSGAAFFIRRNVWEAMTNNAQYQAFVKEAVASGLIIAPHEPLGPFLPTRHYYEETFCSYLAHHMGYTVKYDGRISIGHGWHKSHAPGSWQDKLFKESQKTFRAACDYLGIEHD